MKNKVMNKIFALITCVALLATSLLTGFVVSADATTAKEVIDATNFSKRPIYSVDFSGFQTNATPEGWDMTNEYSFLWRGNGSYVSKKVTAAYNNTVALNVGTKSRAHIFTMPALGTENYMFTVKASVGAFNFGIATDIKSDYTGATYASIMELQASNFKVFTRTKVSTWSEDKNVQTSAYDTVGCFTDNTISSTDIVTLKAYHINDVTYFYCNDVYVGEVADYGSDYCDRIGIYVSSGNAYIYSVEVLGLASEAGPEEVRDAIINEKTIYSENFTSAANGGFIDSWSKDVAYPFIYNSEKALNSNYVSCKTWRDENSVMYMGHKTVGAGGGHILTIPALGTENYVFSAKIQTLELAKSFGLATNINNDFDSATSASILDVRVQNGDGNQFVTYQRAPKSTYYQNYKETAISFAEDNYFDDDTITTDDIITLTAYHIDDVTYFYCNGLYINKVADFDNEGFSDRVGFYSYGGNIRIYEVEVKEIMPTTTDIENRTYISEILLSEDLTKYSTTDSLMDGWEKIEKTWAYNYSKGEVAFFDKDGTKALRVAGYGGTGAVMLPSLGTSNYVFTADVIVRDTNCFGLLTNIDDPDASNGATHSLLYTVNSGDDLIYQYNRDGSSIARNEQKLQQSKVIGEHSDYGDTYTLKVYSYEGVTYFFVNDTFVSAINQRSPQSTSRCGIYSYGGTLLVTSVKVSAICGITESDSIKMQGAEIRYADADGNSDTARANGIRFVAEFNAADEIYSNNYENASVGMIIAPASKLAAGEELTAHTDGAFDIKLQKPAVSDTTVTLEAEILNMNTTALNTVYTVRAYMLVNNSGSLTYYFSNQISRSPVGVANLFYADTSIEVSDDIKDRLDMIFGDCEDYLGANDTAVTFTAFADFHYKQGMYAGTVAGLQQIVDRSKMNNVEFMLQCGDFSNDVGGSPELTNTYLNNTFNLPAFGLYGNHELESAGNSMAVVTPTLTNKTDEVIWGTADTKIGDGSIGYYYYDNSNGFRMIFLDTNYSWNPTKSVWEHNTTNSYGPPSSNTLGNSLGPVQLAWLETVLLDAAEKGLSCIVSSHESFSGSIPTVSPDGETVRALFRKVNNIRPKTVVLALNGHQHSDAVHEVDDVVYFNINTANNGFWKSNKEGTQHYTEEHTFEYVKYDDDGNPISTEISPLTVLSGSPSTWYFANPLSATVTVTKSGIVKINGMETEWMYGVEPDESIVYDPYMDTKISSGIFGGQKEVSDLTVEEMAIEKGIEYQKGNRTLVWFDEFDGETLDSENWGFEQSMTNTDVTYSNSAENVKVVNNNLQMNVNRTDDGYTLSQGLSTLNTMSFKYGYLEMRAKVPFSHGAWPSLWAKSAPVYHKESVGWGAEVDIFEVFSSETTLYPNIHKYQHNSDVHYDIQSTDYKSNGYTFENADIANEYHTYGFEWTEDYMKFYVDDVLYQTYDFANEYAPDLPGMDGYREYIYLIINNEIFTENSTFKPYSGCELTDSDQLPEYKIDYIRLYQDIHTESLLTVK